MSICFNCGKNLNSFTECVDPYGIDHACKNCLKIYNAHVYGILSEDFDIDSQKESLRAVGVTESGLSYISSCVSYLQEQKKKEAARAAADTDANASAIYKQEQKERLAAQRKARMDAFRRETPDENGLYYHIVGARGRVLDVYYDKCVITTNVTLGSVITQNATDGEKTIYYIDCTSLQYKKTGLAIGYLQLETSGTTMNNKDSNFFNENSFTFNEDAPAEELSEHVISTSEKMEIVVEFIKTRLDAIKGGQVACGTLSVIEALKGFNDLLKQGIITQEEFDAKKKQLLCM